MTGPWTFAIRLLILSAAFMAVGSTLPGTLPAAVSAAPPAAPATAPATQATPDSVSLRPTAHPALPRTTADFWLVPPPATAGTVPALLKGFAEGVDLATEENFAAALPKVSDARLAQTPVAEYALYYRSLAQLRLGRVDDARAGFRRLNARNPGGVLTEWGRRGEAEAAEAAGDFGEAAKLYESALAMKPGEPDEILYALATTQLASGDRPRALANFRRVYFEFPLSSLGEAAIQQAAQLAGVDPQTRLRDDIALEVGRAQRLFGSKRYAEALTAFETIRGLVSGEDREVVPLRIAECHYYLGRYREALEGTRPYLNRAARRAEARFFHLSATRGLGDHSSYVTQARELREEFPESPWTEEALNNLATHYILEDEDQQAAEVFKGYLELFPAGLHAQRASWKLGWWRYRERNFQGAVDVFERAAFNFPRSDYRPPYLYWAAKAHDQLGRAEQANARYALVAIDYLNSYYGRLADETLDKRGVNASQRLTLTGGPAAAPITTAPTTAAPTAAAPTAAAAVASSVARTASALTSASTAEASVKTEMTATDAAALEGRVRRLVAAGLYGVAVAELQFAQRNWGSSPRIEATLAWLYRETGDLRRGINLMKRAYPQYLTVEGRRLPVEAQKVIFPLEYWTLIRRHATARGLDPYLIAALVCQESNFVPDIRSPANAYGLMQLVPETGRRLARSIGIRRFSTGTLTNPETNVRLGTLHFQKLVDQFGGAHFALASYNAGENRVERWIAERPSLPKDEFIDDIPFPETQNYVKRILGTAEDYRRLYGN